MANSKQTRMFGPYKIGKTLGQGEFGKVKLAFHVDTSKAFAIKFINKESINSDSKKEKLLREVDILKSLDNQYIAKLYEVIETENYIGMIMGYYSGGELFNHILARKYLKEKESVVYFAQLIAGVEYMHKMGIVHRDLKLENLLLDEDRRIIITDFGFANKISTQKGGRLNTSCGSPCYAAPELVVNDSYSGETADIWSCGVILYAMLCGYLPFDDDPDNKDGENIKKLYRYILETKITYPRHVSILARSLIDTILVTDPNLRASISTIKEHKWMEPANHIFENNNVDNGYAANSVLPDLGSHVIEPQTSRTTMDRESRKSHRRSSLELVTKNSIAKEYDAKAAKRRSNSVCSERTRFNIVDNPVAFKPDDLDRIAMETQELNKQTLRAAILNAAALTSVTNSQRNQLKFHKGPIDSRSISTLSPAILAARIKKVTASMGLVLVDSEKEPFKFTATRTRWTNDPEKSILSAVARYPKELCQQLRYFGKFGRQFNYGFDGSSVVVRESPQLNPDESLKMSIFIRRIRNLDGLVTVGVKRIRGNIWDFKRVYQRFIESMHLGIHSFEPDLWTPN